jgi:hypothetical protein
MTTVTIDSLLLEKPLVVGANSVGYKRSKILLPNLVTQAADSVASIAVGAAGTGYTGVPTVGLTGGGGSGATAVALMEALTAIVSTAQAASGSYAPADTITLAGGTGTVPILTVATTKVVSATVAAAGTGGVDGGLQTVTGTTGTGTKFQASVSILSGSIVAVNSITVAGNYTVNPTSLTAEPVTGASLAGAQLNVVMGVLTATVSTPGSLSAVATNPALQASTSGAGTGATFNMTYGVDAVTVTDGGEDYATAPTVAFTGGAGSGATATATIGGSDDPITVSLAFSPALPTDDYTVKGMASQACVISYDNKTVNGVDITMTPLDGETLTAATLDAVIEFTN